MFCLSYKIAFRKHLVWTWEDWTLLCDLAKEQYPIKTELLLIFLFWPGPLFVVQVLLMEYLDVKNSRSATEPSAQLSYASTGSEFAAFFSKKKPQRAKQSLFK